MLLSAVVVEGDLFLCLINSNVIQSRSYSKCLAWKTSHQKGVHLLQKSSNTDASPISTLLNCDKQHDLASEIRHASVQLAS